MFVARHGEGRAGTEGALAPAVTAAPVTVAVASVETLRLVTARPTYTVAAMGIVSLPIKVQLVPVVDWYAEKVEPLRTNRTQRGTVPVLAVLQLDAPVVSRRWNATPPGVTPANAYREAAVEPSRIMTPAFARVASWSEAIRATISPFPLSVRYAAWN